MSNAIKVNQSAASLRRMKVYLVDATDGFTEETGVTSPTVYISKNGGAPVAGAGSWSEIDAANMPGAYYYQATAGEVDTVGDLLIRVSNVGCRPFIGLFDVVAYDAGDAAGLGLGRLDAAVSSRLATGGYTAPDNATIAAIAGYLDTEIASIISVLNGVAAKTVNLPAAPAAVGDIPTASANAAAVGALVVENTLTLLQTLRLQLAVLVGESNGAKTTTMRFRDTTDAKNRVTATLDTDGNRTAVTLDAS